MTRVFRLCAVAVWLGLLWAPLAVHAHHHDATRGPASDCVLCSLGHFIAQGELQSPPPAIHGGLVVTPARAAEVVPPSLAQVVPLIRGPPAETL
jgi:hypothetical protein